MNVTFSGRTSGEQKNNSKMNPAVKGALCTAGVLGTTTGISWVKEPQQMKTLVAHMGGPKKYIASYASWLAFYSLCGAIVNTALNKISQKVKSNNNPKAN